MKQVLSYGIDFLAFFVPMAVASDAYGKPWGLLAGVLVLMYGAWNFSLGIRALRGSGE